MNYIRIVILFIVVSWCHSIEGRNRVDSLKWSIEYGRIFPKYFFFHQNREDETVSNTMIQNASNSFSISRAINNRMYLSFGFQRIIRNFHQNYTMRNWTDYYRKDHTSWGGFIPLTASYEILRSDYLSVYFQAGVGFTRISDQTTNVYTDSFIAKVHPYYQLRDYFFLSNFYSGLAGLKIETNLYKKRLFFVLQSNYICELKPKNYSMNSSNRITVSMGLRLKFDFKPGW